jgi:hypothetical protein
MRRTVTPLLPKGETRQTYTFCDAFYVSTDDPECPHMHLTKELLLCFVDLPQRSASDILGIHKCSLVNVRKKFGLPYWPYVKIMGGYWEMTKFQVVNHREAVIKRLLTLVEKDGLPMDRDTYFECKQAKFFLGLLGAAVSKAFVYWRMHGRFANSELFQTHGSDGCFKPTRSVALRMRRGARGAAVGEGADARSRPHDDRQGSFVRGRPRSSPRNAARPTSSTHAAKGSPSRGRDADLRGGALRLARAPRRVPAPRAPVGDTPRPQ